MPDIFDEVQEDLRAERARRLMARYGGLLALAAVLVAAGVGAWQGWNWWRLRESGRAAETYLAATRTLDAEGDAVKPEDRQRAIAALAPLSADGSAGYRTLARLREAALKADAGDLPGALALWDRVGNDAGADRLLRDLAALYWSMHQIDGGDVAQVEARLQPVTAPENPLHSLAEEAQALLALRQNRRDAARDILKRLAQDVTAPEGVRGRANGLLSQLGG